MKTSISRRRLLALSTAGGAGWALRGAGAHAASAVEASRVLDTLVLIHLRGGADGLSIVVPYGDDAYHRARPNTAIAPPHRGVESTVPLDDYFGLHPALADFKPMFDAGDFTGVVAVGSAERTPSHVSACQAVEDAIARALGGHGLHRIGGELVEQAGQVAKRIRAGKAPRALLLDSFGWDTHAAQGNASGGRLTDALLQLGGALRSFRTSDGRCMLGVRVIVFTEFGRSLVETPLGGTDDGHASIVLLAGRRLGHGRIAGRWPGLEQGALSEGRHVAPTMDIGSLVTRIAGGAWLP